MFQQVVGQFEDQSDVPLIGSYASFSSTNSAVASVNEYGALTAISKGYSAITVTRGDYQAATAVTVGSPQDFAPLHPEDYDPLHPGDELFVYPSTLTLPVTGGQREFIVKTLGGDDLSSAADGTIYILGDSRVINVTVDAEFDEVFEVGASFTLDLGEAVLEEPAHVAVPVPASFAPGETVYFFQKQTITLADGSTDDIWLVMELGVVGADGFARTTSPPYPGFSAGAQYRLAKADQPDKLVSIGFGAPPYVGYSIGIVSGGYGIPLGLGLLPIPYTLQFGITFQVYSRSPNEIPYATQTETYVLPPAGTVGEVMTVDLPLPNPNQLKPVISVLEFIQLGDAAKVRITGQRFNGAQVEVRQLGYKVTVAPAAGSGDNVIILDVPAGVITGLSNFRVKHPQNGSSNIAYLRPTGGLGAVAPTGIGGTFFETDVDTNQLVRKFSLGGGSDTVFKPNLTRAYVTTSDSIAVIDTMAIRQADVDLSTGAIDTIPIPGFVHQITVDPLGHFLYAAGYAPTVWVIDIRPTSNTFNQVLRTIDLPRERPTNAGLAVSADGKHLLVGTGTDNDAGYMTIFKLDTSNEPWPGNLSPGQWGMQEHDVSLPGIPLDITPSPDPEKPEHIAFTYRYSVTVTSPWSNSSQNNLQRIGLMNLGTGAPTTSSFLTKVVGGNLQSFATPYYNGYYTNILTPRDLVLTPDLSHAFIADWELHLVFGYGGQYGDKVGVIRDPFNLQGKQQYLGATTPVDSGCTTSVALRGDSRLFASYGCVGEVLVMDSQQLIAAGESMAAAPFLAERTPLDQVAGFNVHITLLTVNGLLRGLATQDLPSLSVWDASGDDSRNTVFQDGALRVSYDLGGGPGSSVDLKVLQNGSVVGSLGTFTETLLENKLVNLADLSPAIAPGKYEIRARRTSPSGNTNSILVAIQFLPSNDKKAGTSIADTFNYAGMNETGVVYFGNGGTDTLNLGLAKSEVKTLNGSALNDYNPATNAGLPTDQQAIYRGSSFDYLRLSNGREIYFQGIERLQFTDGAISLQVLPNDPLFPQQWNLTVTDTADAWRYTKGANEILLVSLDSGLPNVVVTPVDDLNPGRIVYGNNVPDGRASDQHGHEAISILAAEANNGYRIAGINWNSTTRVENLYNEDKIAETYWLFGIDLYTITATTR